MANDRVTAVDASDAVVINTLDELGRPVQRVVRREDAEAQIEGGEALEVTPENAETVRQLQRQRVIEQQTPGGIVGASNAAQLGIGDALSFGFLQRGVNAVNPGAADILQNLREQNRLSHTGGYVLGMVLPALFSGGSSAGAQALRFGTAGGLTRFGGDVLRRMLVRRLGAGRAAGALAGLGEGALGGILDNLIRTNTQMEAIDGEHLVADGLFGAALGLGVGGLFGAGADDIVRGGSSAQSVRQARELADRGLWQNAERAVTDTTPTPQSAQLLLSADNPNVATLSDEMQDILGQVSQAPTREEFLLAASNQAETLSERLAQGGPQAEEIIQAQSVLYDSIEDVIRGADSPPPPGASRGAQAADDIIEGEILPPNTPEPSAPRTNIPDEPPVARPVSGENGDFGGGSFGRPAPASPRPAPASRPQRDLADVILNHFAGAAGFAVGTGVTGSPLAGAAAAFFSRKAAPYVRQWLTRGGMASTRVRFEAGMRGIADTLVKGAKALPEGGGVTLGTVTLNSLRAVERQEDEYNQVTSQLRELLANPEALQNRLATTFGQAEEAGTDLSHHSMDVAVRGVNHLVQNLPPASRPTPFDHLGKVPPSKAEIADFMARYETIEDPLTVLDRVRDRTLMRAHVEAMSEVYPQMYAATRQRISEILSELQEAPAYQDRLILGQLMQFPADATLSGEFIAMIQNSYAQSHQQRQQQPQRAGGSHLSMSIANNTQSESLEIRTNP